MIVKGIVSAIYPDTNKVEVILPEYNGVVTEPLSVYRGDVNSLAVKDFVMVVVFNGDFKDCMVLL